MRYTILNSFFIDTTFLQPSKSLTIVNVFINKSEEQKTKAVKLYIDKANELSVRFEAITSNPPAFIAALGNQEKLDNLLEEFKQYHDYVKKKYGYPIITH